MSEQFPEQNPTELPRAVVGDQMRRCGNASASLHLLPAGLLSVDTTDSGPGPNSDVRTLAPTFVVSDTGPIVLPFGLLKQKMMQQMHSHEGAEINKDQPNEIRQRRR